MAFRLRLSLALLLLFSSIGGRQFATTELRKGSMQKPLGGLEQNAFFCSPLKSVALVGLVGAGGGSVCRVPSMGCSSWIERHGCPTLHPLRSMLANASSRFLFPFLKIYPGGVSLAGQSHNSAASKIRMQSFQGEDM